MPTTPEDSDELTVELPPDPRAPATARAATRDVLRRWRLGHLLEDVLLAVSELVANAVRHGRPPVRIVLRRRPGTLLVDVHDDSPTPPPTPAEVAPLEAEGGRGLQIVGAVAQGLAIEEVPDDGKVVRVSFDAGQPDPPAADGAPAQP